MPQTHRHELRPARHLAQLPTTMVGFGQSVEIVSRNQFQKLGEYGIDVGQGSRPFDVSGVSRNNTLAIVCDAEPCDLSNHGTAVGLTPVSEMPRKLRIDGDGLWHHVMNRAIDRE